MKIPAIEFVFLFFLISFVAIFCNVTLKDSTRATQIGLKLNFYIVSMRWLLILLKYQFRYQLMRRCWQEDPLQRPTFTKLRDELEEIMSQEETYISFDFDEDSNYFLAPSFNSVPSEHEDDDGNASKIGIKSNIVRTPTHSEHLQPTSAAANI